MCGSASESLDGGSVARSRPRLRTSIRSPRCHRILLVLCLGTVIVRMEATGASFAAVAGANASAAAFSLAAPGSVQAILSANVVPLLTCRASVSWNANPDATSYELRRVVASTGAVDAGPWVVGSTSFVDTPVPLQLIGGAFEWQVRAALASWRSEWVTATVVNPLLCLI